MEEQPAASAVSSMSAKQRVIRGALLDRRPQLNRAVATHVRFQPSCRTLPRTIWARLVRATFVEPRLRGLGGRVFFSQRRQDRGPLALGLVLFLLGVLALLGRRHRAIDRLAAQQRVDVVAVERLVLEQRLGDLLELLAVVG